MAEVPAMLRSHIPRRSCTRVAAPRARATPYATIAPTKHRTAPVIAQCAWVLATCAQKLIPANATALAAAHE